ncbi:hypothetical protein NE857_26525 [Nocardiopsis exhalans]|uniref:Uncharacterized protein n=1 Tax=Nocardiopsis exhalans TaxID=163604 RepID=A0ABY5DGP7_9ACTN|nr:hypothetical protein [Nocardiopsis exhalans]USY23522.1 hypothetical protein NE857_26525 [Nocardiopsis exhalans]
MQAIDLVVIVVYLLASAWLGLRLSGRQRDDSPRADADTPDKPSESAGREEDRGSVS